MMPELYLADALGAAGKPMMRVHTAGSVGGSTAIVAAHLVRAGVHERVLTVAFEKQSESDAMWALSPKYPFRAAARRRGRRVLRAARPRVHPALRRAGRRRHAGRGEGPAERAQEPVRPPSHGRHLAREGEGVADALGPDPLPRDVPFVGRRVRDGARRARSAAARAPRRSRPGSAGPRCAASRRSSPGATRWTRAPGSTAPPTSTGRPGSPTRAARSTWPRSTSLLLVRADVAREPRLRRAERRVAADDGRG